MTVPASAPALPAAGRRRRLRLLQLATFTSSIDRFAFAPLLLVIAADLALPLRDVALAASLYFLLYGVTQPLWGLLSDRWGRVPVMRCTLAGACLAGLASAAAPDLTVLVVARAASGALMGAVVPAALVYVADVVPFQTRPRVMADLLTASALGTALATAGAGFAAGAGVWRVAFAVPAVAAGVLAVALRALPEPVRSVLPGGPLASIGLVLRRPWALLVLAIALVEGALLIGLLTFLPAALVSAGGEPGLAGLVVAGFGVASLSGAQLSKRLSTRLPPPGMVAFGGSLVVLGIGTAALSRSAWAIGVSAVLLGLGFSLLHPTLQTWATDVVPSARGTVVSLFVAALFTGSAVSTRIAAPVAEAGDYHRIFVVGALAAVPLVLVATAGRASYRTRSPVDPAVA